YKNKFLKECKTNIKQGSSEHMPELILTYRSNIKNERYVSIMFTTYYSINYSTNVIETINYDLKEDKLLTIDSFIDNKDMDVLANRVINKLKDISVGERIELAPITSNYNNFYLGANSIRFFIRSDDNLDVSIPYINIEDICSLRDNKEVGIITDILNVPEKKLDPNKKMIALSFDDGPNNRYTPELLNILKEYNARATFFVLGDHVEAFPKVLERMVLEGHEIGNHTFDHKQLSKLKDNEIKEEIDKTQKAIKAVIDYEPKLIRPPYGEKTKKIKAQLPDNLTLVTWSIDTLDWKSKNTNTVVNKTLKECKDKDIILMHDLYPTTLEAVRILVPELIQQDYQLVTISEILENQ
ncbi:MAG: polysaccharide deacetylase family protein, partial [Erysipelotrichaceae bacterium]